MSHRAVFLDRDGTLSRERGFITAPEQIEVLPGVVTALHRLRDAGFQLVVVTNQSGVARGLYSENQLARIHDHLHASLDRLPVGYFHCPHHPEADPGPYARACDCRKPGPGLLHQAGEVLRLQLPGSFVVGDSARDVLMADGLAMGTVLVQTGKPHLQELALLRERGSPPDHVAADLTAATDWILDQGA